MKKVYSNIHMKRFLYFNLYVIKGVDGDILIDTGFIGTRKRIEKWLKNFNIKLIILTHAHVDHTWNVNHLKNCFNCKVALGIDDIKNLDNKNINSSPSRRRFKLWTKLMNFGMKRFKSKSFDVDMKLENNQIIKEYGLDLKVIALPGHTDGSIGILYKDYFFVGDGLVYRGKKPTIAYQNQDNDKAIESYKKIFDINPNVIFFGHDKEYKIKK